MYTISINQIIKSIDLEQKNKFDKVEKQAQVIIEVLVEVGVTLMLKL